MPSGKKGHLRVWPSGCGFPPGRADAGNDAPEGGGVWGCGPVRWGVPWPVPGFGLRLPAMFPVYPCPARGWPWSRWAMLT